MLPELVTTSKDADQTKGLNYLGLVPVMIKAIQEQQTTIDTLQQRNAELDARNDSLRERVAEIERQISELLARIPRR